MKQYGLLLFFLGTLEFGFGQQIKATWFFDENRFFKFDDSEAQSESFNFIKNYKILGDSLLFKHADNSIPDSKFLISKLTSDSLFLIPINNSAKAISAKLRLQYYGTIERIEKNPEANGVLYFKEIKLYNASTLFEKVAWDTLTVSHTTMGWWGVYYFDIKILNNGHFFAIDRHRPFKKNKKESARTIFYEDNLPDPFIKEVSNELNNSGLKRIDKIDFTGWSSHGRKITLKVVVGKDTKLLTAYEYCFPYALKSLVRKIADLEKDQNFKTTDNQFIIETSFINIK